MNNPNNNKNNKSNNNTNDQRFDHDSYFKSLIVHYSMQKQFLLEYLPPRLSNYIDFNSIKLKKDSFIDPELKQKYTDALISVKIKGRSSPTYCYLLAEHQSSPDYWMSLRLWSYMIKIWEKYIKDNGNKKVKLPTIYPVIIYNGWQKHNTPQKLMELCAEPQEIANILNFPFHVENVNDYSPEDAMRQKLMGLVRFFMNRRVLEDKELYMEGIEQIYSDTKEVLPFEEKNDYIKQIICYNKDIEKQDVEKIKNKFRQKFGKRGEEIMKSAVQEYREEGMELGREKGVQEGIQKGKIQMVKGMLIEGFDISYISKISGLSGAEIRKIKAQDK